MNIDWVICLLSENKKAEKLSIPKSPPFDTFTNISKKLEINVRLNIPKDEIKVLGIGDRIAQVFYNLVDNALSFSKPGSSIEINAWTTKNEAIIEVKDQGPGIPKENLGRIFERF